MNRLKLLIDNLISYGIITETKVADGKALARVKIGDRNTDFYPVVSISNSFKKHFIPVRIGEQVVVFSPMGEASSGFIIRGIFNKNCKEPSGANNTTEIIDYEDGTRFSYDTKSKKLIVKCAGDIELIAKNITISADSTRFVGGTITHDEIPIDKTHLHPQTAGDHFGGGTDTSPPKG